MVWKWQKVHIKIQLSRIVRENSLDRRPFGGAPITQWIRKELKADDGIDWTKCQAWKTLRDWH
jgi:hypothetical protein